MINFLPSSPKILIVRFSSFGDIIKTSVLPRILKSKYPDAKITFITKNNYKELIEFSPFITKKIYFEKQPFLKELYALYDLRKKIKNEKYDIIVDAHSSLRSKFITAFMRPKFKARYNKSRLKRFLLFVLNINLMSHKSTQEEEFAKLLAPLKITDDCKGSQLFFDSKKNYEDLIKKHKLTEQSYICFVPGAAWPGKQVNIIFFNKLVNKIIEQHKNCKIVLLGGKKELALAPQFANKNIINLVNKLTLLESIYMASKSKITIGNDTGLIHAAEAAGGKIAVFLGPTSKETGAYPSKKESLVFERHIFCRPCSKNGSSPCFWGIGTRRCLKFDLESVYKNLF